MLLIFGLNRLITKLLFSFSRAKRKFPSDPISKNNNKGGQNKNDYIVNPNCIPIKLNQSMNCVNNFIYQFLAFWIPCEIRNKPKIINTFRNSTDKRYKTSTVNNSSDVVNNGVFTQTKQSSNLIHSDKSIRCEDGKQPKENFTIIGVKFFFGGLSLFRRIISLSNFRELKIWFNNLLLQLLQQLQLLSYLLFSWVNSKLQKISIEKCLNIGHIRSYLVHFLALPPQIGNGLYSRLYCRSPSFSLVWGLPRLPLIYRKEINQ